MSLPPRALLPLLALATARAWAQSPPRAPLTHALGEGMMEMQSARLLRFGDMAGETFDAEPEVDAPPEPVAPATSAARDAMPWSSCEVEGSAQPVDLQTGNLIPLQVALASRGTRSVALVTLGRPGGGRRGMIFPESRWVEWDGQRATVTPTPGFHPDAEIVLRDDDATVLSYADAAAIGELGDDPMAESSLALSFARIGSQGRVLVPPRVLDDSLGLGIDSRMVAWGGGTAVVLGRPTDTTSGARRESVYFLDGAGQPMRAPEALTDEARDDGYGAPCADLALDDDRALIAGWTVPEGPRAGLWVRRGIGWDARRDTPREAVRVVTGEGLWGPEVSPWGVVVRRAPRTLDGDGPLTDVLFAPWTGLTAPRRDAAASALFWDPRVTWSGRAAVLFGERPGEGMRLAHTPPASSAPGVRWMLDPRAATRIAGLRDPIDVAVAPSDDGAVVAWIEADDAAAVRRRLSLARVGCRLRP